MLRIVDKMGKLALYCCIAVVLSSGTCTAGLLLSVAGGSVTIPEDNSIGNIVSFSVTNNLGLPVLFTSIAIDSVLYSGESRRCGISTVYGDCQQYLHRLFHTYQGVFFRCSVSCLSFWAGFGRNSN